MLRLCFGDANYVVHRNKETQLSESLWDPPVDKRNLNVRTKELHLYQQNRATFFENIGRARIQYRAGKMRRRHGRRRRLAPNFSIHFIVGRVGKNERGKDTLPAISQYRQTSVEFGHAETRVIEFLVASTYYAS